MKFGTPLWLKRTKDSPASLPPRALVKYEPPLEPAPHQVQAAADLTAAELKNGWTPETLAAYRAESDTRAMSIVAASMEGRLRPRPRWANNRYDPLHWRGPTTRGN